MSEVITLDRQDAPWLTKSAARVHLAGPGLTQYGWNSRFAGLLGGHIRRGTRVVVHGLWQHHAVAARSACRAANAPYVVYPHGMLDPWALHHSPVKQLYKALNWTFLMRPVLRDASLIVFTTDEEQSAAAPALSTIDTPQAIVSLGVGAPPGPVQQYRTAWGKKHPELASSRMVLFLGRLHQKKGCEHLIKGFARWKRGLTPSCVSYHLRMAGPPSTRQYLEELISLSENEGLLRDLDISFPGMKSGVEKWEELAAADAFILPSFQENFGIVVGEALATGLPVLVSDKVNTASWVLEGQAGFVAPPSQEGVVTLLNNWTRLDAPAKLQISLNSLKLYQKRFSPELATNAFLSSIANL